MNKEKRAKITLRILFWETDWNVVVISVKERSQKEEQVSGIG